MHYNGSSSHILVTNAGTIQIVLILMLMADWHGQIVDIEGAFLHEEFKDGEVIYKKVPREDVVAELILMVNPLYRIMSVAMLNYEWCLALRSVLGTSGV